MFDQPGSYLRTMQPDLNIEDVLARVTEFQPLTVANANRGFDPATFWVRLVLRNPHERDHECWISVGSPRIQHVTFHQPHDGGWKRIESGTAVPRVLRPLPFAEAVFPILLKAGEKKEFFLQVRSETAIDLTVSLSAPATYHRNAEQRLVVVALGMGGALIASVLSFAAFAYLRDRQFVPFGTLYFFGMLLDASREGVLPYLFWPSDQPYLPQLTVIFGAGGLASLIFVLRNSLSLADNLCRWDKFLKVCTYILSLTVPLSFVAYAFTARGLGIVAVIFFALSIGLTLICHRKGIRSARLIMFGFGLFWIFEALRQMRYMSFSTSLPGLDVPMACSLLVSSSLIVVALLNRARELSRELFTTQVSSKAKSDFLARVSHELVTPLNAIIGYARMLNRRSRRISIDSGTKDIIDNGVHLMSMINELLDQSKIDLGRFGVVSEPVVLRRWLNDACRFSKQLSISCGNTFTWRIETELPKCVSIDSRRLRQVIDNLVSNANRHTRQGRIELSVRAEVTESGRARLCFQVNDNGSGILPEDQARIFTPFFQSHGDKSLPNRSGIGLGLSISREIVRLMRGDINFSSQPGLGSQFSFWIEYEELPKSSVEGSDSEPSEYSLAFQGLHALIVTRNKDESTPLIDKLNRIGLATSQVLSFGAAKEAMTSKLRRWNVVLVSLKSMNDETVAFVEWACATTPSIFVIGISNDYSLQEGWPLLDLMDGLVPEHSTVEALCEALSIITLTRNESVKNTSDTTFGPTERLERDLLSELECLVEAGEISGIELWCNRVAVARPDLSNYVAELRQAAYEIDFIALRALAGIDSSPD